MSVVDNHLIDMEPHLLKACKEQRARIAELEADIEKLRNALEATIRLHNGDGPSAVPSDERVATVEAARKAWLDSRARESHNMA